MNLKALMLIFLVFFAAAAAVSVVGLSSSRTAEKNVGFTGSYSVVHIGTEALVQPTEPIDTPGMPG